MKNWAVSDLAQVCNYLPDSVEEDAIFDKQPGKNVKICNELSDKQVNNSHNFLIKGLCSITLSVGIPSAKCELIIS